MDGRVPSPLRLSIEICSSDRAGLSACAASCINPNFAGGCRLPFTRHGVGEACPDCGSREVEEIRPFMSRDDIYFDGQGVLRFCLSVDEESSVSMRVRACDA